MVVGPQHAQTRRSPDSRRIAVIGAGAAGLCAARHLSAAGLPFVVFEQTGAVGGTWVYNERVGLDQFGLPVHSSMYRNLRINIPKCIMSYPDFPFPEGGRSYAAHSEVLDHLKNYAQHFDLYKYVQFHTHVKRVSPQGSRWNVLIEQLEAGNVLEQTFDCVLVCNGHYSKPYTPVIPGASKYTGHSMHSHDYREPSRFVGKDVVVLGASASGMDIAVEVSTVANKVYLCHNRDRLKTKLPNNVHECVGIKEALEDGFRLLDGTIISADIIVYCTGYEYDFSFLAPECGIRVQNNRVTPLYKHMVHRDHPSLILIGIPYTVIPFLVFHYQVRYFVSIWTGRVALPSSEQMALEEEEDFKKHLALFPAKHAHKKQELQWDYMRDLAESGAFEDDMPPVVRNLYNNSEDDRTNSVLSYRNVEFKLSSKETYERLSPSKQTT